MNRFQKFLHVVDGHHCRKKIDDICIKCTNVKVLGAQLVDLFKVFEWALSNYNSWIWVTIIQMFCISLKGFASWYKKFQCNSKSKKYKSFESSSKLGSKNFDLGKYLFIWICIFLNLFVSCKTIFKTYNLTWISQISFKTNLFQQISRLLSRILIEIDFTSSCILS